MTVPKLFTADELLNLPDPDRWELIEGALHEVSPSGQRASVISVRIVAMVHQFSEQNHLGFVSGADGGYIIQSDPDTVIVPDVGFISHSRMPSPDLISGYVPAPPDFAVEVISPSDRPGEILQKQALYSRAGVALVWWVDPELQQVSVFRKGQSIEIIEIGGSLSGDDVLPGFALPVQAIFA